MVGEAFKRRRISLAILLAVIALSGLLLAKLTAKWESENSELMPLASASLLLDIVQSDTGFYAVGERGHLLFSTDGKHWQQISVPTRSTLTSIAVVGAHIWAAGHDGVIVHSSDDGKNWTLQRYAPWQPEDFDPSNGIPILDLLFTDERNGIAVGAFNLMLRTDDGGASWRYTPITISEPSTRKSPFEQTTSEEQDWTFSEDDLELEAESDPHLNAIVRSESGALLIAGERGALFRSFDDGKVWQRLNFPYDGSMFGLLTWTEDQVLAFGLRGKIYESSDLGESWSELSTDNTSSLMAGIALDDGAAVLVGADGALLLRANSASSFQTTTHINRAGETGSLSAVAQSDDDLILVGEKGVEHVPLPEQMQR